MIPFMMLIPSPVPDDCGAFLNRAEDEKLKSAGFLMCADPTERQKDAWIWRLLVDKNHQGFGVGTFAVNEAIARYLKMDIRRILVSWKPQANNPSGFYQKLGFKETGEIMDGEVVAAIDF